MGPFPYIFVQDLKFQDGEFVQTNTVFNERSFVSWDRTNEQPKRRNDEWYWLAGNTVRVRRENGNRQIEIAGNYDTTPVRATTKDNIFEYEQSWNSDDEGVVHLALPPNFTVDISSLNGHTPFYAKFDRGRICLDWFTIYGDPTDFTIDLIKHEEAEFRDRAEEFERAIRSRLKNTKRERNAAAKYGIPSSPKEAPPSKGGLEYWLKIAGAIVALISAVFVAIPQASSFLGPFDYTAEALLTVSVLSVVAVGLSLILAKAGDLKRRLIGVSLVVVAPLLALLLWYSFLRLSPKDEANVQREVALGDAELILHNPARAREHYGNAAILAPRRGSIRAKMQDAEARMKLKGE